MLEKKMLFTAVIADWKANQLSKKADFEGFKIAKLPESEKFTCGIFSSGGIACQVMRAVKPGSVTFLPEKLNSSSPIFIDKVVCSYYERAN